MGSHLLFCTTGVLTWRLSDTHINGITHLVVDEVHEHGTWMRTLLLALLRPLLVKRPSLRVILMSATMDTSRFSKYFADLNPQLYKGRCPVYPYQDSRIRWMYHT